MTTITACLAFNGPQLYFQTPKRQGKRSRNRHPPRIFSPHGGLTRQATISDKRHDQGNIDPGDWRRGSNYHWLRKQHTWRTNLAFCRRSEGLRTAVGDLATDSRRGERSSCTRKCAAKYNPRHGSQYLPISKSERRRNASCWTFHRQSRHETQTSGLDCRRWTARRSTHPRHLRNHRREP